MTRELRYKHQSKSVSICLPLHLASNYNHPQDNFIYVLFFLDLLTLKKLRNTSQKKKHGRAQRGQNSEGNDLPF